MTRAVGIAPAKAAEQFRGQKYDSAGVQPLPEGEGGGATPEKLGITESDPLKIYVIGDHGGVKAPSPQNAVSYAMQQAGTPDFVYSVGDVVYFNGDEDEYQAQFYEPYGHLACPIVAIPGNHDGDTTDDPSRLPLDTFMANFCTPEPQVPAADPQLEFGRHTQTQPYCYWTYAGKRVTIIGLYSNVASGGHIDDTQAAWLIDELKAAPVDVPLIVALHHPPVSVDAHHGGCQKMGEVLDQAFENSGVIPAMVLAGHVHDFQHFERTMNSGARTQYVVIGNSGYHNLHKLADDAEPGMQIEDVTFEYGDDSHYGFLALEISGQTIEASYTQVTPGSMPDGFDAQVTENAYSFAA